MKTMKRVFGSGAFLGLAMTLGLALAATHIEDMERGFNNLDANLEGIRLSIHTARLGLKSK